MSNGVAARPGEKYASLVKALEQKGNPVTLSFGAIEEILGFPLPASARKGRQWWANCEKPTAQQAWTRANLKVSTVDFVRETVTFTSFDELASGTNSRQRPRPMGQAPSSAPRAPRSLFDPANLRDTAFFPECLVSFGMSWKFVGNVSATGEALLNLPALPSTAGIYRLTFRPAGEPSVYIGETAALSVRFSGYRKPGPSQETNKRIREKSESTLSAGGSIDLDIATEISLIMSGTSLPVDLQSKAIRRMLEHAAIAEHMRLGIKVENR